MGVSLLYTSEDNAKLASHYKLSALFWCQNNWHHSNPTCIQFAEGLILVETASYVHVMCFLCIFTVEDISELMKIVSIDQ